jgi:hypothetical protein
MSNFSDAAISLGVACVVGGEERAGVGLADEVEEGFPAAGDDGAEEFGMGRGYLVGVDCGLCGWGGVSCVVDDRVGYAGWGLGDFMEDLMVGAKFCCVTVYHEGIAGLERRDSVGELTGGTLAKSPGTNDRALSLAYTVRLPF